MNTELNNYSTIKMSSTILLGLHPASSLSLPFLGQLDLIERATPALSPANVWNETEGSHFALPSS